MSPEVINGPGLRARGITVRYGGHVAVDGVDIAAPLGSVTGLIGPNGAGKTTLFNACNGLLRPSDGTIELLGQDVTGASVGARARLGLGRTFQKMEICDGMTVRRNVLLGRLCRSIGANPLRQFASSRTQRAALRRATDEALELCGITDLAERPASALSTGQRRLLELARVVCGGFEVLLLDEPSSGLDEEETSRFGEVLEALVADRGVGILLVEHDMSLVMKVCRRISVLDFGRLVFEGEPVEVQASPVVRAAYLGEAAEERDA
jgi:ABC-type branched-subunit amino acid transport system ATPase component